MAFAIALAVGLATLALILVLAVGLIRHLKLVAASLRTFQEDVEPILQQIQSQSARAQERLEGLTEGPGGRLRR